MAGIYRKGGEVRQLLLTPWNYDAGRDTVRSLSVGAPPTLAFWEKQGRTRLRHPSRGAAGARRGRGHGIAALSADNKKIKTPGGGQKLKGLSSPDS